MAAAAWAAALPETERASAVTTVLSEWAATAPAQAAAWLTSQTFQNTDQHALALAALINPWTTTSPAAVSRYLNTIPPGPLLEAAASQFAVAAAATAPAESLMWAMNLTDPLQRNQVVADACEAWYTGSPDTFRAGISEAIGLMEDPAMRRSVYEMLYERDPTFQTSLLQLVDGKPLIPAAPTPATSDPAPTPPENLDPFAGPAIGGTPADPVSR